MIDIRSLTFKYIGRKAEALAGIDLHIEQGEAVLLLGPSGSDKSTLALCLNGLIPQIVGGQNASDVSKKWRVQCGNTPDDHPGSGGIINTDRKGIVSCHYKEC